MGKISGQGTLPGHRQVGGNQIPLIRCQCGYQAVKVLNGDEFNLQFMRFREAGDSRLFLFQREAGPRQVTFKAGPVQNS